MSSFISIISQTQTAPLPSSDSKSAPTVEWNGRSIQIIPAIPTDFFLSKVCSGCRIVKTPIALPENASLFYYPRQGLSEGVWHKVCKKCSNRKKRMITRRGNTRAEPKEKKHKTVQPKKKILRILSLDPLFINRPPQATSTPLMPTAEMLKLFNEFKSYSKES
jgi:hypothetical protein